MVEIEKLRDAVSYLDVEFSYKGKHALIIPYGSDIYDACYGDEEKRYTSLETLMNDKFYDGKSLTEIAKEIDCTY